MKHWEHEFTTAGYQCVKGLLSRIRVFSKGWIRIPFQSEHPEKPPEINIFFKYALS